MIKRILFATDFAGHTAKALSYVLDLAKCTGASVDVFHAIEPVHIEGDDHAFDDFYFDLEKKASTELAAIAESFRRAGVSCSTKVVIERRWQAILERAESERADLIVLGSRSARDRGEGAFGRTSHRVFFASDVPLLIVPTDRASDRRPESPGSPTS